MEDCKREVKHILLAKFKEDLSEEQIKECLKEFANFIEFFPIPSIKSFKWGKEMSIGNYHQGFTHVFETIFESAEDVAQYLSHPLHNNFAEYFIPKLEKFVLVDFEPVKVQP